MAALPNISRRSFIVGSAAAAGGLAIGLRLPPFGPAVVHAADGTPEINAWVVIRPGDTVVIRIDLRVSATLFPSMNTIGAGPDY